MAKFAGLQDEGEDARCFSAPLPVGGIQGQGFDRHSEIIGRKGGEGHPFTHQAQFCPSPFQQLHIHFGTIGPQQEPAQITYLPEVDAPFEEMLQDVRKDEDDIIIRCEREPTPSLKHNHFRQIM